MPIVIKEINIKINVNDEKVDLKPQELTVDDKVIHDIISKCTKEVLKNLKKTKR